MTDLMEAEVLLSVDEWAAVIRADMTRTVESVLETGRHLKQAKTEIGHGNWMPLLKQVGMSQQTANRLMTVAVHPVLSNHAHARDLPSGWSILYELTKLPDDVLESAIADGTIHSDIQRKDVAALRDQPAKPRLPKPAPSVESSLTALWDRTADMDDETKAALVDDLRQLLDNIDKPTPKAKRAEAVEALKNQNGLIVPTTLAALIDDSGLKPTPHAAGMLAHAIIRKWGSWASFERDRKQYAADDSADRRAIADGLRNPK